MSGFNQNIIGCVIRLDTKYGQYEGTVKTINDETNKLSLDKVTVLPDDENGSVKKLQGVQNYFSHEIRSYKVLSKSVAAPKKQTVRLPEEHGSRLLRMQPLPFNHRSTTPRHFAADDSDEEEPSELEEPIEPFLKEGPIQWEERLNHNLRFQLPNYFIFIDCIDEAYREAIATIKRHAIVGVAMEGSPLSRDGEACWLLISAKQCVYFFDLLILQREAFTAGLKEILESYDVVKVFHDCRLPSDSLFNTYGVSLENVFDTQAADIALYCRKYNNCLPEYAKGVSNCIEYYLQLDPQIIKCPKVRLACFEKDLYEWKRRPLSSAYRDAAIRKVVFLDELRVVILEKLLSDVNAVTTHFLGVVRDASLQEVSTLNLGATHLIPPGMNKMNYRIGGRANQYTKLSKNGHQNRQPASSANGDIKDMFIGDILDALESNFDPRKNKKQHARRSLPSDLPKSGQNVEKNRLRSCTAPANAVVNGHGPTPVPGISKKTPTENKERQQNGPMVNGHCETQDSVFNGRELTKDPTENKHNNRDSLNSTEESLHFEDRTKNNQLLSTNASGTDSSDDRIFSWPSVTKVRRHAIKCVPAGRLI